MAASDRNGFGLHEILRGGISRKFHTSRRFSRCRVARDRAGRLVLAEVAGVSSCRYLRDAHGAVTNEVQNGVAVPRALDAYGRPAAAGDAAYGYAAAGRLASVSSGELAFALGYLPGTDLPAGWTCGAFRRTVAYEPCRDLVAAVTNAFGGLDVSSAAYGYDAAGRRTSALRGGAAHGPLAGSLDAYGYDAISRLVSVRRTLGGEAVPGFAEDFAYDGAGNRTAWTVRDAAGSLRTTACSADALNRCVLRESPGLVSVRGLADEGATVTVGGRLLNAERLAEFPDLQYVRGKIDRPFEDERLKRRVLSPDWHLTIHVTRENLGSLLQSDNTEGYEIFLTKVLLDSLDEATLARLKAKKFKSINHCTCRPSCFWR